MKASIFAFLGVIAARQSDGKTVAVPIQSLVAKSVKARSTFGNDDEQYGYADENAGAVDTQDYINGSPMPVDEIKVQVDPEAGETSVVQIQKMQFKGKSHLGQQDEEKEENSNGLYDLEFDHNAYIQSTGENLLQIEGEPIMDKLQTILERR